MPRDWESQPTLSYWGDITVRFIITDCCLLFYRESEVAGYVNYEVDNFDDIRNPFMSLETEDPSMGRVRDSHPEKETEKIIRSQVYQETQRNLTGPGREKRKQMMDAFDIAFSKAWKSKPLEV